MEQDAAGKIHQSFPLLGALRLLQLADSALPIGSLAHSFGLESLAAAGIVNPRDLLEFLRGYLEEAGLLEAVFCREAFHLTSAGHSGFPADRWLEINDLFSARKPAREARAGSASLGQNFLATVLGLGEIPLLRAAFDASLQSGSLIHHSTAFGLVAGVMGFNENLAIQAFLHQSSASLVSASQRLLPLGQTDAARILWNLKPAMIETAAQSAGRSLDEACCFTPLLDWGAMEHPALSTRLFIS